VDVPLLLTIVDRTGAGVPGLTPEVAIRRYKEVEGELLDSYWWDPVTEVFSATPIWTVLPPYDAVNSPGLYVYLWNQSKIGLETVYMVTYRHADEPAGSATEIHVITNEVYVPKSQPDPVIFGPNSIMGQLQIIKDGGEGDFDPDFHALTKIGANFTRALGLLHHNSMVDNQTYDASGQLLTARLRVFDDASNVPPEPGGSEVAGLIQEYSIEATYAGLNNLKSYVLKQVL
jgi:hypothetical protein